jgi:hypothetical protein
VRKIMLGIAVLSLSAVACKKTGEGEYEVQKPVIGTVTDTVKTPTVDVTKDTVNVVTPRVVKDTSAVVVPKVKVKKP